MDYPELYYRNLSLADITYLKDGISMIEQWRPAVGFEGLYMVSDLGRVKSLQKIRKNRYTYCVKGERILRQANKEGYLSVALADHGTPTSFTVHIIVASAFIPNPNNYPEVNHKNGNKKDNRVFELEWITHQQNIKHAFDIGIKNQIGSKCPRAILNEDKVIEIRNKFRPLIYTRKMLSDEYGVSVATIKKVLNKSNWSHI